MIRLHVALVGPCTPSVLADLLDVQPNELPSGLVGTPVDGLARGLVAAGHRVSLLTCSPDIDHTLRFEGDQLRLVVVPYRRRARDRARDFFRHERQALAGALAVLDPDVVHAHWTYEFAMAGLTRTVPVVITAHDSPWTVLRNERTIYRVLRLGMALYVRMRIKHLTAVSPHLASKWRRHMLYRREIAVIPNIGPFLPDADAHEPRGFVVIDIADSSAKKNVEALILAHRILIGRFPTSRLILVGRGLGPDDSLARSFSSERNVEFVGKVGRNELRELLRSSSVFAHPSLLEAQPMCFLEAFAFGLPAVGGINSGGVAWTVGNGTAGILVDVKSPEAIADAITCLYNDPALANSLGEEGRRLLRERYSAEAVTGAYVQQYYRALEVANSVHDARGA